MFFKELNCGSHVIAFIAFKKTPPMQLNNQTSQHSDSLSSSRDSCMSAFFSHLATDSNCDRYCNVPSDLADPPPPWLLLLGWAGRLLLPVAGGGGTTGSAGSAV